MNWLTRFWVVPVVAVAIIIGIFVAFQVEDEKNRIAFYAAIVATASILLNVEKHVHDKLKEEKERQKKEDDKKENITANAICKWYGHSLTFGVELYNAGVAEVSIKRVMLNCEINGKQFGSNLVHENGIREEYIMFNKETYKAPKYERSIKLQSKDYVEFMLIYSQLSSLMPTVEELMKIEPEKFSVVVESFTDQVAVVTGDNLLDAMKKGMAKLEADREERLKQEAIKRGSNTKASE
jgi:hypothetical protein